MVVWSPPWSSAVKWAPHFWQKLAPALLMNPHSGQCRDAPPASMSGVLLVLAGVARIVADHAPGENVRELLDVGAGDHSLALLTPLAQTVDKLGPQDVDLPVQDAPRVGHLLLFLREL